MDPLTVNSTTIAVLANNEQVAGTYQLSGATVTITPISPLPAGATVRVYVNYNAYVQDLAGNNTGSSNISFTTASTADTTTPTVVSVSPANNQTGVGTGGQIVVVFSKSMNPSTLSAANIALLAADARQNFSISVASDNRTMTLYNLGLPAASVITLTISSGVSDLSGNALPNFTSQFTTAAAFDTSHASVVSQRPANGATGVLTTASPIALFLSKALNVSTVNGSSFQVTQNGALVAGTIAVVGNGQTIEFTPSAAWTNGALVQVFLDATALDTVGNGVNAFKGSFTVVGAPAQTAPAITSLSPMNGANNVPLNAYQEASFNVPLNPATVIAGNIYLHRPEWHPHLYAQPERRRTHIAAYAECRVEAKLSVLLLPVQRHGDEWSGAAEPWQLLQYRHGDSDDRTKCGAGQSAQ